jgi:outer membrane receptor protein involved in Fe transport
VNNPGPAVGGLGYINMNEVPVVLYTDATITYDILPDAGLQGFLTINNLFDKDPPSQSASFLISGSNFANRSYYDLIGRTFTMGLHYRM